MKDRSHNISHHVAGQRARLFAGVAAAGLALFLLLLSPFILTLPSPGNPRSSPLLLYADPFLLAPGRTVSRENLRGRLARLEYQPSASPVERPGHYSWNGEDLEIYLRDFLFPEGRREAQVVRIRFAGEDVTEITAPSSGEELSRIVLDPELLAGLVGRERQAREFAPLREIPRRLVDAVLAVEDRRFFRHFGVDVVGVIRAAVANLRRGSIAQGGSTITQQLVRNLYLSPGRRVGRKVAEVTLALLLEMKYSKERILESYLNEIYLGHRGIRAIYGIAEASRHYFEKDPRDLTVGETALLAGLIRAPNGYSPYVNPRLAKKRRDTVLARMYEEGMISKKELRQALAEPVRPRGRPSDLVDAPYFVDLVRQELEERLPEALSAPGGLRVFTTLDSGMQRQAEQALERGLTALRGTPRRNQEVLQGSLLAVEPGTGYIRALVGGRDYRVSQFNRVTQARRQPGSLFKPVVYLAALQSHDGRDNSPFTLVSHVEDTPTIFQNGGVPWHPKNFENRYRGTVTLRTAVEESLNVATVKVAEGVGIPQVVEAARALGIAGDLRPTPALALGASEVTLREMVSAYAVFSSGGIRVSPTTLEAVTDAQGRVLPLEAPPTEQALSPQVAYLVTSALQGVMERGTAASARVRGFIRPAAGKTGTTNDGRDAWFVGYTPDLVAGVWVGFDTGKVLGLSGAAAALPIWVDFMGAASSPLPPRDFSPPSGIVFRHVDPETGYLATSRCPTVVREAFIHGTEPRQYCPIHENLLSPFFRLLKND